MLKIAYDLHRQTHCPKLQHSLFFGFFSPSEEHTLWMPHTFVFACSNWGQETFHPDFLSYTTGFHFTGYAEVDRNCTTNNISQYWSLFWLTPSITLKPCSYSMYRVRYSTAACSCLPIFHLQSLPSYFPSHFQLCSTAESSSTEYQLQHFRQISLKMPRGGQGKSKKITWKYVTETKCPSRQVSNLMSASDYLKHCLLKIKSPRITRCFQAKPAEKVRDLHWSSGSFCFQVLTTSLQQQKTSSFPTALPLLSHEVGKAGKASWSLQRCQEGSASNSTEAAQSLAPQALATLPRGHCRSPTYAQVRLNQAKQINEPSLMV